jgi:hypothetical protein
MKQSGFSQEMLIGDDLIGLRWHNGIKGYMAGFEKNGFAMIEYSIIQLILLTLLSGVLVITPYIGILTLSDGRIFGYILAVVIMHVMLAGAGIETKCGWWISFGFPFAAIIFLWIMWRSTIITLHQGGVKWRDTFYSLDVLRDKNRKSV